VYNPVSFDPMPTEEPYDKDPDTMELMKEDLEEASFVDHKWPTADCESFHRCTVG
jgi:hypothetical protein